METMDVEVRMSEAKGVVTSERSTWTLDPSHTLVEFSAKHMMIARVKGRFGTVSGTVELDESDPSRSSAEVTIDASSIDTRNDDRDAHLRSADFLDVENHPTIEFRSKRFEPQGEDRYQVVGDLTIRGVTREVVLEMTEEGRAQDPWGNYRIGVSGEAVIDRRDFGLTWNQALEAGGVLVGHEIRISLEVELVAAGEEA